MANYNIVMTILIENAHIPEFIGELVGGSLDGQRIIYTRHQMQVQIGKETWVRLPGRKEVVVKFLEDNLFRKIIKKTHPDI
jgi:hypothetical protein